MPSMSAEELKERLTRDLPGALAPARAKAEHVTNGSAAPQTDPPAKPKKGAEGPVDLLATNDAIVLSERIPDVVRYVRDTLGYTFLTDLTAVDYMADGLIELIYRFLHLDGGPTMAIKTRVPRDRAVVVASHTPHEPQPLASTARWRFGAAIGGG